MKIVGLITEYNPFHLGHKLHLEESLRITGADHSVCIMSGSFVQRGEPAIVDKWTRARMAVEGGVDLVLELPFIFAAQSAEVFAYGGVRLLDSTNCVDHLAFGSEEGMIDTLDSIADLLVDESEPFKFLLKKHLSLGNSFSTARSLAITETMKISGKNPMEIREAIAKPNNILGIEYLKALKRLDSKIKPITFKRIGHGYKDTSTDQGIASATAVRRLLLNDETSSTKMLLPESSYELLMDFYSEYGKFNCIDNYTDLIRYLVRKESQDELLQYMDMETGLENRLKRLTSKSYSAEELVSQSITKRYPGTRIRRLLIHIMTGMKKNFIEEALERTPEYVRVLASNTKGFEIINEIKRSSDLKVITKFSDAPSTLSNVSKAMLEKEVLATDVYYLALKDGSSSFGKDFSISPYIK